MKRKLTKGLGAVGLFDSELLRLPCHRGKIISTGLTMEHLCGVLKQHDMPEIIAQRAFKSMFRKGVAPWDHPSSTAEECQGLKNIFHWDLGHRSSEQKSVDGTIKFLTELKGGGSVETVLIPKATPNDTSAGRFSLCVSSQVGCSLTCSFCHTGAQSKANLRNLSPDEYISQVIQAHLALGRWPRNLRSKKLKKINNIVFMGQGEPLLNYRNLVTAIRILTNVRGLSYPWNCLTISTSGVAPAIRKLTTAKVKVRLALSLHAPCDELRTQLVPLNATYPIHDVLDAAKEFSEFVSPNAKTRHNLLLVQYTLLKGVNDSLACAKDLAMLIRSSGLECDVHVIPFNSYPGAIYETTDLDSSEAFRDILLESGINAIFRPPRGGDILAACGQLNSDVGYGFS